MLESINKRLLEQETVTITGGGDHKELMDDLKRLNLTAISVSKPDEDDDQWVEMSKSDLDKLKKDYDGTENFFKMKKVEEAESAAARIRSFDDISQEDVDASRAALEDPKLVAEFKKLAKLQSQEPDAKKKRRLEVLLGKFGTNVSKKDLQKMVSIFWGKEARNKVTTGKSELMDGSDVRSVFDQSVNDEDKAIRKRKDSKFTRHLLTDWSFGQKEISIGKGNDSDPFVNAARVDLFVKIADILKEVSLSSLKVYIGLLHYAKVDLNTFDDVPNEYKIIFDKIDKIVDVASWRNMRTVFAAIGVSNVRAGDKHMKDIQAATMKASDAKTVKDVWNVLNADARFRINDTKVKGFNAPVDKNGEVRILSREEIDKLVASGKVK